MINNKIFIYFLLITIFSLSISYIAVFIQLKKANIKIIDLLLQKNIILDQINFNQNNFQDIHHENFLKFLSDSRDWAFNYIETSQSEIALIAEDLKKDGMTKYYERLSNLLPKDENINN
jgi:hypothetical protein